MTTLGVSTRLAAALLLLTATRASAQPASAGTPVADTHLAAETNPSVVADGVGGAFVGFKIAWRSASLPAEIAVAHVLPSAGRYPEWNALPLVPVGSLLQTNPAGPSRVLPAPGGRALAFADVSIIATPRDVVREVEANGASPGYPGFEPSYAYNTFSVMPRSDGGALILSKALGGNINCLATVVSPAGTGTEVFNQVNVGNGTNASVGADRMAAAPCSGDGAIAVLMLPQISGLLSGSDLVAVRVDGAGNAVWAPSHRVITNATHDQVEPVAVSDGADGVIIAWRDPRSAATGADIYAIRLLASGGVAAGWSAGGKSITAVTGAQTSPAMVSDDAGGAWLAWVDGRGLLGTDIYYTHLLGNGTTAPGFPAGGKPLCSADSGQTDVQLARDGSGGAFAVWLDPRDTETDLYAQHIDMAGNPTAGWPVNGAPVCTNPALQSNPVIALVSPGRAITAWSDPRTGTDVVYAAALDATRGVLDAPAHPVTGLALAPRANPARGAIELAVSASEAGPIRVSMLDVSGRVLAEQVVPGPVREMQVRFEASRPGLYFLRASQHGVLATSRVAFTR